MDVNLELKGELVKRYGTQVEAAKQLNIAENRLSRIVRGYAKPSERERTALIQALGASLADQVLESKECAVAE